MRYGHTSHNFNLRSLLSVVIPSALSVGGYLGYLGYNARQNDLREVPLAFSEINAHRTAYANKDMGLPALTEYYAKTNDLCAKIFEANNLAHSQDGEVTKNFAKELQKRMDVVHEFPHDLISEYLEELPEDAREALGELSELIAAGYKAGNIHQAFASAWDEHHRDYYREEVETYTETSIDSDGNITNELKTRTVEVYDYSIHRYDYNPQHGARANTLLIAFASEHGNLNPHLLGESFSPGSVEPGEDNLKAMTESRKQELDGKPLDSSETRALAQTWITGSNLYINYGHAVRKSTDLNNAAPTWKNIIDHGLAHSHRYRTNSRFDSGPQEFRVAESAKADAAQLASTVNRIVKGIQHVRRTCPQLTQEINEAIDVGLGNKDGNAQKEMNDVLNIAREIYEMNFEGGFDVSPTSWTKIVLLSLLAAAAGGAAGYGMNCGINYYDRRNGLYDEGPAY